MLLGALVALASGSCADLVGANFDIADTGTQAGGNGGAAAGSGAGGSCLGSKRLPLATEFHTFPRAVARRGCSDVAVVGELWTDRNEFESPRRPFVALAAPEGRLTSLDISLKPIPDGAFEGKVVGGAWDVALDAEDNLYFGGYFMGVLGLPGLDPIKSHVTYAENAPPGAVDGFLAKLGPGREVDWMLRVDADEIAAFTAVALDPKGERVFSAGGITSTKASLFLHKGPPGSSTVEQVGSPIEASLADGVKRQTDVVLIVQEKSTGDVVKVAHLEEPGGARSKESPLALAVSEDRIAMVGFYTETFPFEAPDSDKAPVPDPPGSWFGFVAMLDREDAEDFGKLRWAHGIGAVEADASLLGQGYVTYASSVAFLGDQSVVVVGGFVGGLQAIEAGCASVSGPVRGQGSADVFVARLDPGGKCLWMSTFGGRGRDIVDGLAVHPASDEIFVHGTQGVGDAAAYVGPRSEVALPFDPTSDRGFVLRVARDGELLGYRGYDRGGAPAKEDAFFTVRHTAELHAGSEKGELFLAYPSQPVDGSLANGVLEVFDADIQLPPAP